MKEIENSPICVNCKNGLNFLSRDKNLFSPSYSYAFFCSYCDRRKIIYLDSYYCEFCFSPFYAGFFYQGKLSSLHSFCSNPDCSDWKLSKGEIFKF